MCARYPLSKKREQILKAYAASTAGECSPDYNLALTKEGLVITADEPAIAQKIHFGLIPYWGADTKLNIITINARTE
jgi:putative SOS response-associated peptidase YedK